MPQVQTTTSPSTQSKSGADLIVFNADIFTGNLAQPAASAFAVKNGRIYSVGADAEIMELRHSGTRMIDAAGRRLIPGISDAHIHLLNESNFTFTVRTASPRWRSCEVRCATGP